MGKGYKHGGSGGAALNFNVKTYPSETELKATQPGGNTVGVITTTTMTSWAFIATEPAEPEVGMVWIPVGTSSVTEFNAIKSKTLMVYPLSAKQYEGGKWVDKVAFSYQNGEWAAWWRGELFDNGNQWDGVTGGWTSSGYVPSESKYATKNPTISDKITLATTGQLQMSIAGTANTIDLTKYKSVVFTVDSSNSIGCLFAVVKDKASFNSSSNIVVRRETGLTGEVSLDVSSVSGNYYVVAYIQGTEGAGATTIVISKVQLKE